MRVLFTVSVAAVLSGCSDIEQPVVGRQVETVPSGDVVDFHPDLPSHGRFLDPTTQSWERVNTLASELDDHRTRDEVCAASGEHCFRVVNSERIEESTDGGTSWTSIWRIDADSAATATGLDQARFSHGPVTITDLALSQDSILVVQIDLMYEPIVRWPDGTWSHDEQSFRSLPYALWAQMAGMAVLMAAGWFLVADLAAGRRSANSIVAPIVAVLLGFIGLALVRETMFGWFGLWIFGALVILAQVGVVLVAWIVHARRLVARWQAVVWLYGAALVVAIASSVPLRAWSATGRLSAESARDLGMAIGLMSSAVALTVLWKLGRERHWFTDRGWQPPAPAPSPPGSSLGPPPPPPVRQPE